MTTIHNMIGPSIYQNPEYEAIRQFKKFKPTDDLNYAFWTICGCCGSRLCVPTEPFSVEYFNKINQGIQLMVNPKGVEVLKPGNVPDNPYNCYPNQFELVDIHIDDVHLLFKITTHVGERD